MPLSFAQQRLWFLDQLEGPSADVQHPARRCGCTGALDRDGAATRRSRDVVGRHEALRTVFPERRRRAVPADPRRRATRPASCVVRDGRRSELAEAVAAAARHALRPGRRAAAAGTAVRGWRRTSTCWCWSCTTSPATAGRWRRWRGTCRRRTRPAPAAQAPEWEPLPVQYADYALWQRELLGDERRPGQRARTAAGVLAAGAGRAAGGAGAADRPAAAGGGQPPRRHRAAATSTPELHARLVRAGARPRASRVFMVLQAALAVLLARLGAGTDIPIGTPVAGRTDEALDDLVGFFVNTLVLRTDLSGDPTFRELLAPGPGDRPGGATRTRTCRSSGWWRSSTRPRSLARHPLFQVMLALQNNAAGRPRAARPDGRAADRSATRRGQVRPDASARRAAATPTARRRDRRQLEYATDLFDRGDGRGARRAARPAAGRGRRRPGPAGRRRRPARRRPSAPGAAASWNDTARDGAGGDRCRSCSRRRWPRTPDATAVRVRRRRADLRASWTRGPTGWRAGCVAPRRRARSAWSALCAAARRSTWSSALLGVLKAGGAVPAARPGLPGRAARVHARRRRPPVLRDRRRALADAAAGRRAGCLDDADAASRRPRRRPASAVGPEHPAYVIYTSGSTGRPKGVVVAAPRRWSTCCAAMRRAVPARRRRPGAAVRPRSASTSSVLELFVPLLAGGRRWSCRRGRRARRRPSCRRCSRAQRRHGRARRTPSLLGDAGRPAPTALPALARRWSAARRCRPTLVGALRGRGRTRCVNAYGPTETTV